MAMITQPDDFFTLGCGRCDRFGTPDCSTRQWIGGLNQLRALLLAAGLTETVKWAHPCYMFAGRNIALIGAFRTDFRLNFMNASLLKDPQGILQTQGENGAVASSIFFTNVDEVAEKAAIISAYLEEAKAYAAAGVAAPKIEREMEFPPELADALDDDPQLAEAFHRLTPGRQKSYLINLNGAKNPATRISRIAKFRDHILAGKGALER